MSRFVRPDVATLPLSNGDTLTVRRRLTAGEQRELFARLYLEGDDGRVRRNPRMIGFAAVAAYLIDWTFRDDAGALVAIRDKGTDDLIATLQALDPDDFQEVRIAIDAHVERMDAERTAEKNGRDGGTGSPATSPSRDDAAGGSTGSATSTPTSTTS